MNSRWIVVCVFVVLIVTAIGIVPGKTVNAELDLTGSPGGLNSLAINPDFSTSSETLPTSNYVEADNVELIGHIGGATPAIAVQGSYAYVGEGPRLTILDISDPASPIVAGKTGALFKLALDVTVAGNYAYIADNGDFSGGIRIIDVSHPATPTEASYFEIMGHAYAVDVSGDYAYVAANDAGLAIVDVSNPEAPFEIGYYDLEDLALDVAVAGHYAYIVTYYDGLRIINISDPTAPTEVAFEPYGRASGVAVAGNYVYVADDRGLTIVDISDPDTPIAVQSHYVSNAERVAVAGNYAYVLGSNFHDVTGDFFYGIQVINIADPTVPVEAGYYETSGEPLGVAVAGDHAYVTDESGGLRIVSVTDPNMPTEVGRYEVSGYAYDVAIVGSHAYVTSRTGLHVINIANPAVPTEAGVGFFESFENPGGLMSLAVSGDYAYVTDYFAGLRIINLSNPITPIESGFFETTSPARDVVVSGDYAYIANDQDGLRVIDISNPTAPIEIGFFDTPGTAIGVAVSGDYAYVADDQAGLRIINISDPTTPIETGFIDTPKYAMDVAIAGNFAYVSDGLSLRIVNIANPAAPVEVGFYGGSLYTYFGISVIGDFAFVANTWMGLYVFNISNPEFPTLDGYYDTSGWASHVEVSGGYAYVADQKGGLAILRFTESQPHYSVSGQIVNQSGMPVSGVTVTISGSPSATTNAQGRYTINGVTTGTLTITPSKAGIVFSPASRTISVNGNTSGIDFRATSGGAVDLSAYALEVTQGIQDLNNSVRLVAGKRTFVRFYAESNGGLYATTATLTARKGTQEVTIKPTRIIADPVGPRANLNRGLLTQGFLFELPDGFRSG